MVVRYLSPLLFSIYIYIYIYMGMNVRRCKRYGSFSIWYFYQDLVEQTTTLNTCQQGKKKRMHLISHPLTWSLAIPLVKYYYTTKRRKALWIIWMPIQVWWHHNEAPQDIFLCWSVGWEKHKTCPLWRSWKLTSRRHDSDLREITNS